MVSGGFDDEAAAAFIGVWDAPPDQFFDTLGRFLEGERDMAPKAGQIKARTRTAIFEIEGDDWQIEYRPFSQNLLKEVTQGDDDQQLDGLVGLLERVVLGWNLTDDDDKPMPFDAEWLRGVGLDYVRMILEGLMEDMQGKKGPATRSSAPLALVATA